MTSTATVCCHLESVVMTSTVTVCCHGIYNILSWHLLLQYVIIGSTIAVCCHGSSGIFCYYLLKCHLFFHFLLVDCHAIHCKNNFVMTFTVTVCCHGIYCCSMLLWHILLG